MLNISLQNQLFEQIKKVSSTFYTMQDSSISVDAEIEILDNGNLKVYGKGSKKCNTYIKDSIKTYEEYTKLFANKKEAIEMHLENIQNLSKGKISFEDVSIYIENNIVKCYAKLYKTIDNYTQKIGYIIINTNTFEIEESSSRRHEEGMEKFLVAYSKYINNETSETEIDNLAITQTVSSVPQTQQPQNKIIEQVSSESIRTQLYEALQNNDVIGYTFNLRGIPQAIYSNYDINDRLFIVINPSKLQAEYVDFYIYSLDAKIHEVYSDDDIKQLENLYHNNYTEFLQVVKKDGKAHINQYSVEHIEKYFVELFDSSNPKAAITEPITPVLQDQQTSEIQEQSKQTEVKEINNIVDGYIILKEADNVQIIGKIEPYTSYTMNETYNQVTDIKILKDNDVIYENYKIDFPIDVKDQDIMDLNNYLDDIILYMNNVSQDIYWTRLRLDELLKQKSTIHFQIAVKQLKNDIVEKERHNKDQQEQKEFEELKKDIINLANSNNIIAVIGIDHIKLINNPSQRDIKSYQESRNFIEMLIKYKEDDKQIQPYLVKTFKPDSVYSCIDKSLLLQTREYLQAM